MAELPDVGLMKVRDAETGHEQWIDTSSRALRRAHNDWWIPVSYTHLEIDYGKEG